MRLRLLLLVAALGCQRHRNEAFASTPDPTPKPAPSVTMSEPSPTVGGARPTTLFVPSSYRRESPLPLVVMLHGYGVNGDVGELAFRLRPMAEARGFLYVHPDGTPNAEGKRYWNATDACCASPGDPHTPDDVQYLSELVGEIVSKYSVDPKRIWLVGHSNGGFMAHRMACEHPELFAAVVSVAGATWADAPKCRATKPIAILQIHGTKDDTIHYEGGSFFGHVYPSVKQTIADWVSIDGCAKEPTHGIALDLDRGIPGPDTEVLRWTNGCRPGGRVDLWSIEGGGHIPNPTEEFRTRAVDWLYANPKP